jgi:hypothetical protein
MVRYLAGFGLALVALMTGIALFGGRPATWLHPIVGAFFFVGLMPGFVALAIWPQKVLTQAFRDAFQPAAEPGTLDTSRRVWQAFEHFFHVASLIALFSGLIITFNHLSYDPANLGPKLGASLVSPFYGILLALAARALRTRVEGFQQNR